jgi:hypothetical protein
LPFTGMKENMAMIGKAFDNATLGYHFHLSALL